MRNEPRRLTFAVGALALVGVLAACAESSSAVSSPSPTSPTATSAASSAPASTPAAASGAVAPVTANGVTVTGDKGAQPDVTVTAGEPAPTALVVQDVYTGDGQEIAAGGAGTFNYEGVLFSDGTVFDSSWKRGQPITFSLSQVIPGWQQGIVGMKEGGRRLLIIPPGQAYGARALQGIPPNSTLVFVVDLNKVN